MAIEVKDIAEILGFTVKDTTTAEEVKTFLDEKFVSREHAPKDEKIKAAVFGKTVGSIKNSVKKLFEFEPKFVDENDIEVLLEEGKKKFDGLLSAAKETGKEGKDKKYADMEILIADKDKSLGSYKTALQEKEDKINELTTTYTDGLKNYKTEHKLSELKARLPFIEDYKTKEVLRAGFESVLKSKAKFSLNDKDELEVFTADGNPIKHPKKTGEFLKPDEYLSQLAEEQGLLKKNNAQEKKAPLLIPGFNDSGQQPIKSKVHPNALKNANRVEA